MRGLRIGVAAFVVWTIFGMTGVSVAPAPFPTQAEPELLARARAIHDRVLTVDSHADIDVRHFTSGCNYTMPLTTQVTLPRMSDGGLDAAFFVVAPPEVPANAEGYEASYRNAIAMFEAIHALPESIAPDRIELARSAGDVPRIARSGRRVAIIGVEGGAPIGTDLSRVKEFYDRGARYMSLAHDQHTQLADSHIGERRQDYPNRGLSQLGRAVVAEMNRLGMMVDLSHPSREANLQTLQESRAPVIASHSAVRALANVSRNLDDDLLLAIKRNGGVVQVVAYGEYLHTLAPEDMSARSAAMRALIAWTSAQPTDPALVAAQRAAMMARMAQARGAGPFNCPLDRGTGRESAASAPVYGEREQLATAELRSEYDRRRAEIEQKWPPSSSTVKTLVDHIDYIVKKVGLDHVGISSDFGGGGGITGWSNASETFNVTLELVRRGYTESAIEKIWGGNLLRVWAEVERVASKIQLRTPESGSPAVPPDKRLQPTARR